MHINSDNKKYKLYHIIVHCTHVYTYLLYPKFLFGLGMAMLQVFRIEEDSKKDALLEVISDKYCRDIMNCVMDKPRSVLEITADTGIPVSTVYRRIQSLCDAKLLAVSGDISDDGKKFYLYKSKVKSIQSVYNDGKIEVEMAFN